MKKTFLAKSLFLPSLFLFLLLFGGSKALAAASDPIDPCKPYDASWKLTIWKAIDVQNTIENLFTGAANSIFAKVFGASTNDVVLCETDILPLSVSLSSIKGGGTVPSGNTGFGGTPACGGSATQAEKDRCDAIKNNTKTAYMYNGKPSDLMAIDSSLVGISNKVQNTVLRDPIAVNLAYYWKSQVAKIPFVGRSYAATLTLADTNSMAIIHAGLSLWQACRNIALGFMAVILMYTGLMIVMRKKVNPQLVVTVQYAIPKIIIGLILILFSYPIGAAITGLSWGLFRSSTDIVVNAIYTNPNPATFAQQVLLALVIGCLKMGFVGGLGFVLVILVAVATLVMMLVVYIKALIIYLKMVFSTIIAPFELALGTVPGSEDRIKDWFLRMAKYGLTIFAMGLIIPATLAIAYQVLMYYSYSCHLADGCAVETAGLGSFLFIAVPLMIVIMGFSLAFKMEAAVDGMISGGVKGKRK